VSGQPLKQSHTVLPLPRGYLLAWNSVVGERYIIQYVASIATPNIVTNVASVTATTPLSTFEVVPAPTTGFFQIIQVFSYQPTLTIEPWTGNQVRLSWSTAYPNFAVQRQPALFGVWTIPGLTVTQVGGRYVAYDSILPVQQYYRLIK